MSNNHKRAMMAKIHIAKKQLGLDDDTYRAVLERVTSKRSCKDMTSAELEAVIKDLQAQGFAPKTATGYGKKPDVIKRRQNLMGKIEAMLADMSLPWSYAHNMAANMFEIKRLEWLSDKQLYKVTQALSVYQRRQAQKRARLESQKRK